MTRTASQCHAPKLDIACASASRRVDRRPSRKGQDYSGNPPAGAWDEDEKRQRRVKTHALKDLPARIDDQRCRDEVVEQAVMSQFHSPA